MENFAACAITMKIRLLGVLSVAICAIQACLVFFQILVVVPRLSRMGHAARLALKNSISDKFSLLKSKLANFVLTACCIAATSFISGCASDSLPAVLDFGTGPSVSVDGQRAIKQITWPPADTGVSSRYAYAGELYGEENFRPAKQESTNFSQHVMGALRWLVGMDEVSNMPITLQRPQSGVVDQVGQRILVSDTSRQAVYVFDQKEGRLDVWENATSLDRFIGPSGIALGLDGEVYVADTELGYVTRLNKEGASLAVIGQGVLSRPLGVAFDAETQQLYVADVHAHDIKVFDHAGQLLRTLGQRGEALGEFNFPTYLALYQGEIYITDTMNARVQVLDAMTGQAKRTIGERGLNMGNLVRPKGVAVDAEGNIYVVESYYDYLLVFNRDGELLLPIGGTGSEPGQFYLPTSVWADSSNRIFVADMFNRRVAIFKYLGSK